MESAPIDTLALLLIKDPFALNYLQELEKSDPDAAKNLAWDAVKQGEYDSDITYVRQLLQIVANVLKLKEYEVLIEGEWPSLSAEAHRSICYTTYSMSNLMRTEFALKLFLNSFSSVQDRHLIVAGLAVTAEPRNVSSVILELAERIGNYSNPNQQRVLDSFRANLRRNFK